MASHRGLDAQPSAKSARGRAADKRDELAPLRVTAQWLETNTLRSVGEREMVRGRRKMVLRPMSPPGPARLRPEGSHRRGTGLLARFFAANH